MAVLLSVAGLVLLLQVGRDRVYTPGSDDVGAILKFECTAYDAGA